MIFEKINKIIEERFTDENESIRLYDQNGNHIDSVITKLLENSNTVSQYSIDYDSVLDIPGTAIYYFSIAYIEDGILEHFTYEIEAM